MSFFTRLSNGWEIAKTSFKVLNAHKELIIFPILSGISLLLVFASFFSVFLSMAGWEVSNIIQVDRTTRYLIVFLFYIVNYFVIVFFNMALMHCAKLYFDGEEVTVSKGLKFSVSRLGAILSWAVFAATVGTLLKIVQDNLGAIGKFIISLIGIVWGVATFFVIPVIAYENVGPIEAVKQSSKLVKEKWGESLGANFSIGMISFLAVLCVGMVSVVLFAIAPVWLSIAFFAIGTLAIVTVSSALNSIFISAIYNNINGNFNPHFNDQVFDSIFIEKTK